MHLRAVPVHSSLPLQKLLYFNFYYSFVFGAAHIALAAYKLRYLHVQDTTRFLIPAVVAVWIACEVVRLRLGYSGNLKEKVPEMSAFFLLTIFPQFPLVILLTFALPYLGDALPLDLAVGLLPILFLVLELNYSYHSVKAFIRKQTADFYRLCQEESLSAAAAIELARRTLAPIVVEEVTGTSTSGYAPVPSSDGAALHATPALGVGAVAREGARALLASMTGAPRSNARLHAE